jgi:hypothetical protein
MICAARPFIATGAAAGIAQHTWVPTYEEQKKRTTNKEQAATKSMKFGSNQKDSISNFAQIKSNIPQTYSPKIIA